MKIKQIILTISIFFISAIGMMVILPAQVYAADPGTGAAAGAAAGAEADTPGRPSGEDVTKCKKAVTTLKAVCSGGVWGLLALILDILTAGIGIVAVGGIAYGALLYTTAADNQGQIQKAKETIRNVVIGLVAYVGLYAFAQFLIPGGVF